MKTNAYKYLSPLIIYAFAFIAFTKTGWLCWLAIIYAWLFIPLVELLIQPNEQNLTEAEEVLVKKDKLYDYILYTIVLLQVPTVFFFLYQMQQSNLSGLDIVVRVLTMGLLCGTFGINVAHELGHRITFFEQSLAKISLLTSLYTHFFIEHNKGHHKHVATLNDPSSARKGEMVYLFYCRTIVFTYVNAWKIANAETKKKGKPVFSLYNEMLQLQLLQICFLGLIFLLFGLQGTMYFLLAAVNGILLLETVNYIEHYGLKRKQLEGDKYERAMPNHSWNSNHIIGRLMLFELSRHSDHHYMASRKYQLLRHHNDSPQMPTGYPGMMILSLIPPLWFYIMHKQIKLYDV